MKQKPLLSEENGLTPGKKAALASLVQQPGWAVVEELFFDAVKRANDDLVKLDPESTNYEQVLKARQMKARERNEFSLLVLSSVDWHIKSLAAQQEESKADKPNNPIFQPPKAKD